MDILPTLLDAWWRESTGWLVHSLQKWPVIWGFDYFCIVSLNKLLHKQSCLGIWDAIARMWRLDNVCWCYSMSLTSSRRRTKTLWQPIRDTAWTSFTFSSGIIFFQNKLQQFSTSQVALICQHEVSSRRCWLRRKDYCLCSDALTKLDIFGHLDGHVSWQGSLKHIMDGVSAFI